MITSWGGGQWISPKDLLGLPTQIFRGMKNGFGPEDGKILATFGRRAQAIQANFTNAESREHLSLSASKSSNEDAHLSREIIVR